MALTALSLVTTTVPADAASKAALSASVAVDAAKTTFTYSLVSYGASGGFKATFKSPHKFKKRAVSLQRWNGSKWVSAAKDVKMSAKGEAVFKTTPVPGATYRAVADTFKKKKKKPVATKSIVVPATTATFNFNNLGTQWAHRNAGSFEAGGRLCSAPVKGNLSFSGGKAVMKVTKLSDKNADQKKKIAEVVAAAKAAQKAAYPKDSKKWVGCPNGVYYNAMISTQGLFTTKSGTVSARVKFPLGQGMHAGVWLQSSNASEIDIIETYGYGKGATSGVHLGKNAVHSGDQQYPVKETARWIAKSKVKKKAWWSKYHTVSVQWDAKKVTVRLDGAVVQTVAKQKPDTDYYLVLSLLSSDWETSRMTKPIKGGLKGVTKPKLSAASSKFYIDWIKVWAA